ncbi:MAG TPA: cache domain-containing protein [Hanamia sp.]|nr:cache domain-containing protein [Hanamia sp.]
MKNNTFLFILVIIISIAGKTQSPAKNNNLTSPKNAETIPELVAMVRQASALIREKGEAVFPDLRTEGSRWRQGEKYIFVLDTEGNMLVHPDTSMEGKKQLDLEDINGKPIIRGLLGAVTTSPDKTEGWYHYEWNVPGGLLPRWKSSFVSLAKAPSGKSYIVGSGIYTDQIERAFVEEMVKDAAEKLQQNGKDALPLFYDQTGPFIAKDAYIFVYDMNGINLAHPALPNLVGRNLLDMKDTKGKFILREMLKLVETKGSGWIEYMWPKPGESISTAKSAFVTKAKMGDKWVLVGSGVYLSNARKENPAGKKMTAAQLMQLVRQGAVALEKDGERALPEFRKKGSKWFSDNTYLFVFNMEGNRIFHAAEPESEGQNDMGLKDVLGRSIGKMIVETGTNGLGEGWVHYMYPEPGQVFPTWKSSFVKRITYPDGRQFIIGSGIYNMKMDKALIEDVVNRAASLVKEQGKEAFMQLRDKKGSFVFMDTYVFVDNMEGVELVNPAQPSLEGKNLMNEKDLNGKFIEREIIGGVTKKDSGWIDYYWYKPGKNEPALKQTFVKKVQHGNETYIVGAGFYQ